MKLITKFTIAGALMALCTVASSQTIKFDLSNEYAANSIHGIGDVRFAQLVKEKSKGAIEIVVQTGGALGYKSKDHFDAVADGALIMADTYAGALGGINPLFLLQSLPFLTNTLEEAKLLDDVAYPHMKDFFAKNKQILLYTSPWPPTGIWAKVAVNNSDRLKRLKIRTYDKNGTIALQKLGANAITMSWADVVPAAAAGSIEAVLASAEGGVSSKLWEFFPHFTNIFDYAYVMNLVHMNKAAFDKLSPANQKAILDAAAETREANWKAVPTRLQNTYGEMKRANVVITDSTDPKYKQDLNGAAEAVVADWLKQTGPAGKAILDEYRSKVVGTRK